MKKLFTQMLAIVSLLLASTVGSWAATVDTPTLPELPTGVLDVQALTTLDANGWAVYNAQAIHSSTKPNWYKNNSAGTATWTPTVAVEIGSPFTNVKANTGTSVVTLRSNRTVAYRIKNASSASIVYARYSAHKVTLDAREITNGTVASTGITDTKTEAKDADKTAILTVELDSSKEYVIYAYSNNDGGNTYFYQLAFKAAEGDVLPELLGAWSKSDDEVVINEDAPTLPTFGVTAKSGSPVKGTDYSVAYSLKTGSTEGILTVDAANGITAINTNVEGTATAVATVSNLNTTGYSLSTTTFEYTIIVRNQPRSSDATLSNISIDGVTIENFASDKKTYDYVVDANAMALPAVSYTTTDENASVKSTLATSIPGTTKLEVTAQDGTTKITYNINFKFPAVEDTNSKYAISKGQVIVGGEAIETGIDGVGLVCGASETENKWKAGAENTYINIFTASTDGNGSNPTLSNNIPTVGTFYKFTVSKNGTINAGIILNASKDFYIVDGEGNEVFHVKSGTKVYKMIPFDVVANNDYYIYATGTKLGFYGFTFEPAPATEATIEISAAGYATYVTENALDFTDNAIEAFAVSAVDATAGKITLTKVTQVPAGEAIIVKGATGTVSVIASAAEITNVMKAAASAIEYNEGDENINYILANRTNGVGFYPVTAGTIAAGKGYVAVPKTDGASLAKGLVFDFGQTTGINTIATTSENAAAYNIAGQRVNTNAKGMVIVNGKKFINK